MKSPDVNKTLDSQIAAAISRNVSAGLAVFGAEDLVMRWCNTSFKKQTWFGGASGGKSATRVTLHDLFETKDHPAILELFNIAVSMGQAYDFQRLVRRGPVGAFPAELRFHKIGGEASEVLICLEISDLSLNKLYDELQASHAQMRERVADLMAAQAELQFSVRMNTISEFGADLAHHLINPVTMCRDIIDSQVVPALLGSAAGTELQHALRYLKDIENFAVWFRKFSNPRMSETQICRLMGVVDDALTLNQHRFSKQGIGTKVRRKGDCNPFVLAIPVDLIMWMNAAFSELSSIVQAPNACIYVDLAEKEETVTLLVHASCTHNSKEKISTGTLEKLAKRLPGSSRFESLIESEHASFSLAMAAFTEADAEDTPQQPVVTLRNTSSEEQTGVTETESKKSLAAAAKGPLVRPLVLIVDDERDIRKLLKRTFKNMNIETVEAADGVEALSIFQDLSLKPVANRIRVIVSDIRMPRMTGPHLLVALREAEVQQPFIFFSSNLVDQGQGSGFKYTNVFYLTKESGLEELKHIVGGIISAEHAETSGEEKK